MGVTALIYMVQHFKERRQKQLLGRVFRHFKYFDRREADDAAVPVAIVGAGDDGQIPA